MTWWREFMVWLDTSTVPLWVVGVVFVLYFGYRFLRDLRRGDW